MIPDELFVERATRYQAWKRDMQEKFDPAARALERMHLWKQPFIFACIGEDSFMAEWPGVFEKASMKPNYVFQWILNDLVTALVPIEV